MPNLLCCFSKLHSHKSVYLNCVSVGVGECEGVGVGDVLGHDVWPCDCGSRSSCIEIGYGGCRCILAASDITCSREAFSQLDCSC